MESQVKSGDRVVLHFTGRTEDEEVFATTKGENPVEIVVGEGKVIPGIENGVIGMQIGESRTLHIAPPDGFGERREHLVTTVKKDTFPAAIEPRVGQQLRVKVEEDQLTDVRVTHIKDDDVTLDANHPLAGQTLQFEIDLLDIR